MRGGCGGEAARPDLQQSHCGFGGQVQCSRLSFPGQLGEYVGSFEEYSSYHRGACAMRKHGGINTWLAQVRSSLDELKGEQKVGQVVQMMPASTGEKVQIQNEVCVQETGKQTNVVEMSNSQNEKPVVDLLQSCVGCDEDADSRRKQTIEEAIIQEQKFIQCIELDRQGKKTVERAVEERDQTSVFIQHYFNPRKSPSRCRQKPKPDIIQL